MWPHLSHDSGDPYNLTISVGIAKAEKGMDLKTLIEEADAQLHEEKKKR